MATLKLEGLEDRTVVVTGGGSGIGRASALTFAQGGASVAVADIDAKAGQETVSQIIERGGDARFYLTDVTQAKPVEAMILQVIEDYGRLDYAHNNAGVAGAIAKTGECSETNWDYVIETNLKSIWLCMKYELIQMIRQTTGVIVNTSSVYGLMGCDKGLPAYVASKHGIIGLTKAAALEYAGEGIRVNAVCPGAIDTPFRDALGKKYERNSSVSQRYPIGRIGRPEEVAAVVVWLCSDAASLITGSAIPIDGGLTSQMTV
jgi:NAD(P)-dependent dehydrogenase (short-subunit alcohol dehydrogenase family)